MTWNGSSTRTACGTCLVSADAYPRKGSSDAVAIPARHCSGRSCSQPPRALAERPRTMSSSRAPRPGVRSAMPVTYQVGCVPVARRNDVSSTPIAETSASRSMSSTSGVPCAVTIRMIVAQPTPSCAATRDTAASWCATWSNAHALARSVSAARGAISPCSSVQDLIGHNACRHDQTRLCRHTTTGRPAIGRSRTHTGRRSFTVATAPHPGQPVNSCGVCTSSSSAPSTSTAVSTSNPGRPNRAVTCASTGAPRIRSSRGRDYGS